MKKSIIFAAVIAALMGAASCSKEAAKDCPVAGEQIELTVTGILGEYDSDYSTKATLVNNIRVAWEAGDDILVFDTQSQKYLGYLLTKIKNKDDREAILFGTIAAPEGNELAFLFGTDLYSSNYEVGRIYTSVSVSLSTQGKETPFLVYGKAKLTDTEYSNLVVHFDFATSVIGTSIDGLPAMYDLSSIAISNLNTKCSISISDLAVGGNTKGVITKSHSGMHTNGKGQYYTEIAVPATYSTNRIATLSIADTDYRAEFTGGSELEKGKVYNTMMTASLYKSTAVSGGLTHYFSVSPCKKVRFSQGNLHLKEFGMMGIKYWLFYDNQYDCGPANYSDGHNKDKSLFCWGSQSLLPAGKVYPESFIDWGTVTLLNGSGNWRTLSEDEWKYLLFERGRTPVYMRAGVTVCGHNNCIVIAPDGNDVQIVTSYNESTWAEAEAIGFVCLPTAGYRDEDVVHSCDEIGYYWSSTPSATSNVDAYNLLFSSNGVIQEKCSTFRGYGLSVRLVTED